MLTRRRALQMALCLPAGPALVARAPAAAGPEPDAPERHGLSVFGELDLAPDFAAMPYADPGAPKGGAIVLESLAPFDTLNVHTFRGIGAPGMGRVFDSLMTGSLDEADALYGLVAQSVRTSADRLTYRFRLRREARFHDGSPLTAGDVAFSLTMLKQQGHPNIRAALRDLESAAVEADDQLVVRLGPRRSRTLPLIVATQPIFSQAFYATRAFDAATLEPPLGSGAYRVGAFESGRFIAFERVKDYWGQDLPVARGQNNFDQIRYECFRDRQPAFEAFKSGVTTLHQDYTSINWAKGYDFPAVADGRVKRETIPDNAPRGAQAWWLNMRRDAFTDIRIRQAVGLAFDFEWTNRNIMFGFFSRTWSYFQNSPMAATGRPGADERALLEPYRGHVPDGVFDEAVLPPVSDGSGQDRANLGRAVTLLQAAGCRREGNQLYLPGGTPFRLEFLDSGVALERHVGPFIKNLRLLGIDASLRVIDPAQFRRRTQDFDFDVIGFRYGAETTPGEDLRVAFGSDAARTPGSLNFTGLSDPAVDALIEHALGASDRAELTLTCRALDRVLRAGHYWVPMWSSPDHWLAYWDRFGRPARAPRLDLGILSTWWSLPAATQAAEPNR